MIKKLLKIENIESKIMITIILCFNICLNNNLQAQSKFSKFKPTKLNISLKLTSNYDDNILKYSEKYLEKFKNNEDEGRFHIKTYDDVTWSPEIGLTSTFNFFKKYSTKLNLGYRFTSYIINNNKNKSHLNFGIQQNLSEKGSIKLSYSYTPEFYIRHYRDEDWTKIYGYTTESFQPFAFSIDNYRAEIQNIFFKSTRFKFAFNYSLYFNNKHFTEYDSKNKTFEVNFQQPLLKKLKLEAGYSYTSSLAKGFDEISETKQKSDDSDASNVEDEFLFRIYWDLPKIKKSNHTFDTKVEFGKQKYTSNKTTDLDQLHAGRVDNTFALINTYSFEFSEKIKISIFYNWYSRNAGSVNEENNELISDEKEYKQNIVGFAFFYNFDVLKK